MKSQAIVTCPKCGTRIDVNETLYATLEREARKRMQAEVDEHRRKYREEMEKLKAQQAELESQKAAIAREVERETARRLQKALAKERVALETELKEKTAKEYEAKMAAMNRELEEKSEKIKALYEAEAEVARLKREMEEARHKAKLEAKKELDETLQKEREALRKELAEESELKLKEKETQLEQLKRQLEEAKRKAEQGSQQLQGEAQELAIEAWLKSQFPLDTVEEIKKGARGGDCLQTVHTRAMPNCGTIYYESKRTKEFQKGWIEKFKEDMRQKGADIGVLVTSAMPKGMERMGLMDGVWVCTFEEFKALSAILREQIVRVAQLANARKNVESKMELLYDYLTSNEFRMRIEAIVEGFTRMQSDLQSERRAMERIWNQRQKQIEKVLKNTTAMVGAIHGIADNALPPIASLALPGTMEEED
ncbi:DUF2130 domain-containing protein [Hydrogenimonas sp.]